MRARVPSRNDNVRSNRLRRSPASLTASAISRFSAGRPTGLRTFLTRDVITVSPTTPIHKAARLMVELRVSGLPVVDDDG
jgi:CBS domain-containing protein